MHKELAEDMYIFKGRRMYVKPNLGYLSRRLHTSSNIQKTTGFTGFDRNYDHRHPSAKRQQLPNKG